MSKEILKVKLQELKKRVSLRPQLEAEEERLYAEKNAYGYGDQSFEAKLAYERYMNSPFDENESSIKRLEEEVAVLEKEVAEANSQTEIEIAKIKAEEAQKQRDHELQMAVIQRDTALAQAEASRLAAEANAKAQEQASSSLDALINGIGDTGRNNG